ncbi:SIN1-domain-containing protein [Gonapodya prolifera JEL478]|uniref:SIN1-domain-containing protein n=1 Tax=Gonapodya prolifera (strain JEL478) TaxID=1344416 RepID=A0A138ZYM5_GONPJ|nr:SIN1-domain-containing protein [Gonapodya prolifera JEL478]|eukprot:KXS09607.1 SIN1-domain-containing protein [Gonapodya prolifera JEL478]
MSLITDPEYAILRMRLSLLRGYDGPSAARIIELPRELTNGGVEAQESENEYVPAAAGVYAQLPTAIRTALSESPPIELPTPVGGYGARMGRGSRSGAGYGTGAPGFGGTGLEEDSALRRNSRIRHRQSMPSNAHSQTGAAGGVVTQAGESLRLHPHSASAPPRNSQKTLPRTPLLQDSALIPQSPQIDDLNPDVNGDTGSQQLENTKHNTPSPPASPTLSVPPTTPPPETVSLPLFAKVPTSIRPPSRSSPTSPQPPSAAPAHAPTASPARPSALSALIHDSAGVDNPFRDYSKWSGLATPHPLHLHLHLLLKPPPPPLSVVLSRTATVEDCIGYTLFMYIEEKRRPEVPDRMMDVGCWELRIVEEDGELDEDFPALDRTRLIHKFSFNQFALAPASEEKIAAIVASRQPPTPVARSLSTDPSSAPPAGDTVFLKIHLYSTLEVKQTTTVPAHRSTTLGEVFDTVCKKRKYDKRQYVFKMGDTKTDAPLDKRLEEVGAVEFCVLKRDSRGAGDIFLRPPDEVQNNTAQEERPMMADEFGGVFKQYLVYHRALLGRSGRLLTLDGDHLHVTPVEGGGVFGSGKVTSYPFTSVLSCRQVSPNSAIFRLNVVRGASGDQQTPAGGTQQANGGRESRVVEMEAGSVAEAGALIGPVLTIR